jgi:hypothetical protein
MGSRAERGPSSVGSRDGHARARRQPWAVVVSSARSNDDLAEAIGRLIRALGRRCEDDDPDTAKLLLGLTGELDTVLAGCVGGWRQSGFTDEEIGRELGPITKQAVSKRWPRRLPL